MENIFSGRIELKNVFVQPRNKSVLLYNISNDRRGRMIRKYLDMNDVKIIEVKKEDYLQPLGFLLSKPGFERIETGQSAIDIKDEMLVMDGFEREDLDMLLDFFRSTGLRRISLKAMVTRYNVHWSSCALYVNLKEEHMRFKR